jgi:DNA-binding SARP family transcriptional activator
VSAEPQGRVEADLLVRVLGPTRTATTTAPPQRRDRVVLAALAVVRGASCSPERLAEALWGDTPPRSAAKVVQGAIGRLRSALGAAAIETVTGGYRLAVAPSHVDAGSFELLLERGRELLALQQFDQAAATLSDALTLWEGEPFSDISDWEPAIIEGARLEELRLQAEELSVEARLFAGDAEGCTGRAQALARESPLRERRWWLLALALYRSGRPGESLDALRRCRAVFRDELGFDVSSDIDDLEAKILRRDPSLQGATDDVPATTTCPWPGLESYDAAAAEMFFGREGDVASALAQLRARGALVVVGPSGVGKSSLLRAGLVPALRSEGRTDPRADSSQSHRERRCARRRPAGGGLLPVP